MKKTIRPSSLKVGMVLAEPVYDNDGELLLGAGLRIYSIYQIRRIVQSGVRAVTIDTEKGIDCLPGEVLEEAPPETAGRESVSAPPEKAAESAGDKLLLESLTTPKAAEKKVDFYEESAVAREIYQAAIDVVIKTFRGIKMGEMIKVGPSKKAVSDLLGSINRNQDALLTLAKIRKRDEETFAHSVNVAVLAMVLGKSLGLSENLVHALGIGGLYHDAGKMMIDDKIMNKQGTLTDLEWQEMKMHPVFGEKILSITEGIPEESVLVAAQHHERCDGSGYPRGLKMGDIHLFGLISAVADVYDAMTSDKVYRPAMMPSDSLAQIYHEKGEKFHPQVVDALVKSVGIFPLGSMVMLSSGEMALVVSTNPKNLTQPKVSVIFNKKGMLLRSRDIIDLAEEDSFITKAVDPATWKINLEEFLNKPIDSQG